MTDDEIEDVVEENLAGPKKVTGDTGSVEQHSIPDQIELMKFKAAKSASNRGFGGLKIIKLIPPGQD